MGIRANDFMKGVLKKWFDTKGYGFVEGEDGETYFLHHSKIMNGEPIPIAGDKIKFDSIITKKGKQASNLMVIND